MRARGGLRTIAVVTVLVAGIAVAQDAPPPKDPPPPAGPEQPPADGPAAPAEPAFAPPAILAVRRKGLKEPSANFAVVAGLDWLRRHRAEDGRWDCDGFDTACKGPKCQEAGMSVFDPGVTGLAVLAFLGAGSTHVEGADARFLSQSLRYLADVQDSEGCIGPRTSDQFQYNHRVATMAVAEALWLTGDEKLLGPATRARDFILASQNPYLAWRYGVRDGDNDTSLTAYAVLALRTCEFAHLDVDRGAWPGALEWFDKMTDPETGRVGYQQRGGMDGRIEPPREGGKNSPEFALGDGWWIPLDGSSVATSAGDPGPFGRGNVKVIDSRFPDFPWSSLTAAATCATALIGGPDQAKRVERSAKFVSHHPPRLDPSPDARVLDLHCLLVGSLLHAQHPFPSKKPEGATAGWRPFRDAVVADLIATQRKKADGCAAGSWDPDLDPFGRAGGRVYSTSMALLALQAPNRFPRVWDPKAKPPKPAKPGPPPRDK